LCVYNKEKSIQGLFLQRISLAITMFVSRKRERERENMWMKGAPLLA